MEAGRRDLAPDGQGSPDHIGGVPVKLIIAVVQDQDQQRLLEALVQAGHGATKLASTGGFLREGNTTLLIATEAEKVEEVVHIIRDTCQAREALVTPISPVGGPADSYIPYPVEVTIGGATVLVLDIERFEKY